MTMFLLQALLWLLIAFLLGYGIGRFLKSLFCRPVEDAAIPRYETTPARVNMPVTATVLGGTAAAIGAVAAARSKFEAKVDVPDTSWNAPTAPVMDWSGIDPHKPILNPPDRDISLPAVDINLPKVDLPPVSLDVPAVDLPPVSLTAPKVDLPEMSLTVPDVDLPAMSLDAGLPTVDVKAPVMDWSGIDPHKPILNPPDRDISLPAVDINLPKVDLPTVSLTASAVDLPTVSLTAPTVDLPEMSLTVPDVDSPAMSLDAGLPTVDVKAPVMDWSGIDPHKPILNAPDRDISLPEVDVELPEVSPQMPDFSMDGASSSFLDVAKVAIVAAGAGLTAKVASALTSDDKELVTVDLPDIAVQAPDASSDWLLSLVEQTKKTYRGHNARAVSRLWGSDSHYDCTTLDDHESISLQPATYDKLGSSHCGVPRAGFVAVGGDVGNIEQGGGILFHYCNIVVCRGTDDTHHFIRVLAD
ncbi:MAG: hypothetical protein L3K52_09370 [Candidatus Thiothrix sulfatifontis]|nr:MAG: hypothetical protein L3K52_09370 [Candidatus Thiothrix sulfatifontis]